MGRTFATRTSPPLTFAAWLRHDAIQRILAGLDSVDAILEIGAGEAALGVRLASKFDYVGVEPDAAAAATARRRLDNLGRGRLFADVGELPDEPRFDLVCAFEVLEHIRDDRAALAAWRAHLRPGGWVLLSVPAGERRFGAADRHVGHHRRYEPEGLRQILADAGFDLVRLERVGLPLGYLLQAARHVVAAASGPADSPEAGSALSGRWLQPPAALAWATRALTAPFRRLEARLPAHRPGTTLVALASNTEVVS